ncbi:MAG: polyprenyl synthetase family protein [Acidobacteriota bacterium]
MPPKGIAKSASSTLAYRLVKERLLLVEQEIERACHSEIALASKIAEYLHRSGGKRLRPAIVLLSASSCGYQGDDDIELGAIVEFIHTATLVHDDIVDGATVRRGHAAANQVWGNHTAVLLGDYLYIRSMAMSVGLGNLRLVELLSDATSRLVEGEILDVAHNGDSSLTEKSYLDIIDRKTASLFAGCGHAGAILAGASREQEEALASYGRNLGMTFQLIDDLLDYCANPQRLGKQTGADLREGKVTLPLILLLRQGPESARAHALRCLSDPEVAQQGLDELVEAMRAAGCFGAAREVAEDYAHEARDRLVALPPSHAREALAELPDFVIERQH